VVIEPAEAAVVRGVYRLFVEEQLSCRHITKRLNATHTRTPTGKSPVWQSAMVRNLRTNRVYTGQARDHYRPLVIPPVSPDGGPPTAIPQDRAPL
jgi:hypothetical protein